MIVVGLALIAALLLAACGSALPGETGPAGGVAPTATNDQPATDFQLDLYHGGGLVDGAETSLSEVLGLGRPVVLNMWAGLCPPCRLEMPDFQEVSQEFGDKISIVGLDVGPFTNLGSSQDGRALIQELGITYLTGTTTDPAVVKEYQLLGMPTTYFIKPDGQILRRWTGLLTADKLTELVQELIEASAGS
ncbi:MAG: TlpA family protein disulfide reductase [Anaerolineae bacterium]|nr:TlpA family protein disulfide reductase [Anaerolineae bacterium]